MVAPATRQGDLEIVGVYRFPHEALIARSAVEAFGIPAWVLDETQIRFRWYLGDALGGVKLAVRSADAAAAREILSGDHSASLEGISESRLPPAPEEVCRRCGSTSLETSRGRTGSRWPEWFWILLSFVFTGGPAPHYAVRTSRRCLACGHEETQTESR